MSSINIFFYSNYCEKSKTLLSMFNSEKLLKFFHLICIDNNPYIKSQIKNTPTIMIKGIPTPYIGSDAFTWLAKIKEWKTNMLIKKINNEQQTYIEKKNSNLKCNDLNLLEFSKLEMNSMSDIFSFFSNNIENEKDESLPQSFFLYNNLGKEYIETKPLENGSYRISENKNYKLDNSKQKELCNKILKERKEQDESLKNLINDFKKNYTKND